MLALDVAADAPRYAVGTALALDVAADTPSDAVGGVNGAHEQELRAARCYDCSPKRLCPLYRDGEFQLTLSEEEARFNTYIDQAIRIATRLQAVRVMKRGGEVGDAAGATERPAKKTKSSSKPSTPRGKDKDNNNGMYKENGGGGGGNSPAGQKCETIAASAAAELLKQTDKKL